MLKKIQKLDIFWKKMIVFGVLFVLAIPLLILVINNLSNRMTSIESQPVFNDVNIPSLEESGIGNLLDELSQLANITTSTFSTSTYAQEATTSKQTTE